MSTRRFAAVLLTLLTLLPIDARADWTRVRDKVRQADAITDAGKKERLLREAYADAQKSVRSAPRISNEYLWLANAAGRLAQTVGSKERIALAKVVKENAEKAIALDANNGAAYMTLGAWHFYVADISWVERNAAKALFGTLPDASFERAIEYLTLAIRNGVDNPVEVLWIRGRAHAELDHDALATADFRACLKAKARNASEQRFQKRARAALD